MNACHREMIQPGVVRGQWWHHLDDGRIQCDLCPRECKLHEGQRGFCFVRQAQDGGIVLTLSLSLSLQELVVEVAKRERVGG